MCRIAVILFTLAFLSCGGNSKKISEELSDWADNESVAPDDVTTQAELGHFNADSAYTYVARQVEFGPRVPNTVAHRKAGDWLAAELQRHGAKVTQQKMQLKAFDGTILDTRNIFAQYNPELKDRVLLLAHWDSRPWADQDPDPNNRTKPIDAANDGASGVAVLLEIARQLHTTPLNKGIDILFVDAEDWGSDGDDESWALGTKYFAENPPIKNYNPKYAILLDMVGGKDATFCREYFSEKSAPDIAQQVWDTAHSLGYSHVFVNRMGSAIMDDHVQLIKAGIPAIDIIDYRIDATSGFNPSWHTMADNLDNISKTTLLAVGQTLTSFLYKK